VGTAIYSLWILFALKMRPPGQGHLRDHQETVKSQLETNWQELACNMASIRRHRLKLA